MKKYFKIILIAVVIGSLIAFFFYKDINNEVKAITNKDETIYLFQAGIFKNYENARSFADNFFASIVYQDGEYYRVIIGISYTMDVKVKLEEYFHNKNIEYYLKTCHINKEFIEKIKNYEKILLKSQKDEVINNIINSTLKLFVTYN